MFQKSVLNKYIKSIDAELLEQKYKEFLNLLKPTKIKQIKVNKELQYQEGFCKRQTLFIKINKVCLNK